jgi:meiotic recombination protein REC8
VTLRADPNAAFSMDFDNMVAVSGVHDCTARVSQSFPTELGRIFKSWRYVSLLETHCSLVISCSYVGKNDAENDSDDDYNPKTKKVKGKGKSSVMVLPSTEAVRANAHTLHENHEFLLANSFDASFGGSGANLSSSQNGCFGFDDTFDGLDIGEGIGEDLVRELGEGWGASPTKNKAAGSAFLFYASSLALTYIKQRRTGRRPR